MRIVPVNLNEKSYNIYIGHNLEATIIDFFKVIQINKTQCNHSAATITSGNRMGDAVMQQNTIRQSC